MGLALQTRAAGFGTGRRRGGLQSPIGSLRVADSAGAAVAVRARGSKPVAPLRAKKSSGGTRSSPLCFFFSLYVWSYWRDSTFFFFYSVDLSALVLFHFMRIRPVLIQSIRIGHIMIVRVIKLQGISV